MDGQLTIIDLKECDEYLVKDKKALEEFVLKLCGVIRMKPYGKPLIKRFGKGKLKGYTAVQLIETSNIIVHLDEFGKKIFIDIFSCKKFNAVKAGEFAKEYFKSAKYNLKTIMRK